MVVAERIDDIQSIVITYEKKLITSELTQDTRLLSGLIILICIYFTYELEFPAEIKLPFIYLQEKLLQIPAQGKLPVAYNNFFRASSCVEKAIETDIEETQDQWNCTTSWC